MILDDINHHFEFIKNGRLQAPPTVGTLVQPFEPAQINENCLQVLARFLEGSGSTLYAIPVVDAQHRPIAIIDRYYFVEFFTKTYVRELFGKRSLQALFRSGKYDYQKPIVIDEACNIEDAAQVIIESHISHASSFMVVEGGRYLGIANGNDLLNIITQRKQSELFYLAHYDSLTRTPNRMLLNKALEQACTRSIKNSRPLALLFIDIDRFKQINDSLGHAAGDKVLCVVAERLQQSCRQIDMVARLGGDEFVILMENLDNPADADNVAQRALSIMAEPITALECPLVITISVGRAIFPSDDHDISALLAKADSAMYEAKTSGRNNYCTYIPGSTTYKPASMQLENELRQAIGNNDLELHFQPQINLKDESLLGAEALIRWRHPNKGLLSPKEFIPLAEETGLIIALGKWALRQALQQVCTLQDEGLTLPRVSVNISALQLQRPDFPDMLQEVIADTGVSPAKIELELTESVVMRNVEELRHTLDTIKSLGVRLTIDDFGTGFSSLSYLSSFPIDCLKIDQSFVHEIDKTPIKTSIAGAIIALADSLSLTTIAEGIERPEEHQTLLNLGCRYGQGYLFARPLNVRSFKEWLAAKYKKSTARNQIDA